MVKIPTRKATPTASRKLKREKLPVLSEEKVKMFAPKRAGIERRKENRAASSLFRPKINPPEIVAPEREIPGKSEMA